jgi:pyruvate,orthophosphate dikinase
MGWADKVRRLKVRTNADTPLDCPHRAQVSAPKASASAAPSICSSRPTRIRTVRQMILAEDEGRRPRSRAGEASPDAARRLRRSCSRSWKGLPVTIRLLDPPLHEFLPHTDSEITEVRGSGLKAYPESTSVALKQLAQVSCTRPILCSAIGACRLGVSLPGNLRHAGPRDLRGRAWMLTAKSRQSGRSPK